MKPNTLYVIETTDDTHGTNGGFEILQELVRCKDCLHRKDGVCEVFKAPMPIDDAFCSFGDMGGKNDGE